MVVEHGLLALNLLHSIEQEFKSKSGRVISFQITNDVL